MPKDNIVIGQLNGEELFENLGETYSQNLKSELAKLLASKNLPAQLIDITKPIYFAANSDGVAFIALEYGSESKIEEIKTGASAQIQANFAEKEIAGRKLYYSKPAAFTFTSTGILVLLTSESNNPAVSKPDDYLATYFADLLEGKYGSINDNSNFKEVASSKGVIAFSFSELDKVQEVYKNITSQDLKLDQNSVDQAKDITLFVELLLEQNSVKLIAKNNLDNQVKQFAPIAGDLNKYISKDFALHVGASIENVDGVEALVDQFFTLMQMFGGRRVNSQTKKMLQSGAEVIESMNGDLVINIANCSSSIPDIYVAFEVKDRTVLDEIAKYADSFKRFITITEVQEDNYKIGTPIVNVYYGQINDIFYLTNSQATADAMVSNSEVANSFASTATAKDFNGSLGGMAINVQEAMKNPMVQQQLRRVNDNPLLTDLQTAELIVKSLNLIELSVELNDGAAPALQRVIEGLEKMN